MIFYWIFHRSVKVTSKHATLLLRHIETIVNKARE